MYKSSIPAAALLLLGSPSVFAIELDPIIVTPTRTAQTADETLSSVSVITRADIERRQTRSVQGALRGLPGVTVTNNGGAGKSTSVFLRGAESDQVLVLIDGIKVGSATLGTTSFEHIPIEQVERIEVVRGPRSSLYGSEAIGGVIQIFTRKGAQDGTLRPFASIGAGSYGTAKGTLGLSGGTPEAWFSVSASGINTGGINACTGKPAPNGAGCFTIEPDTDGYENISGSARAGFSIDNWLSAEINALRAEGETEFDGTFQNETDFIQQAIGGKVRITPFDFWATTVAGGRSDDKTRNFKDGAFASKFNTMRYTASLQNDLTILDDHVVTLGFDYQQDRIASSTAYPVTSRTNSGIFAQYQGALSLFDWQLALREDDNQQFGKNTTGNAALGFTLNEYFRVVGSYGTAFKAPTFNELYFPFFGNPNLDPESSRSYEIGINGNTPWGRWALNAYETRIVDLIAFDATTFLAANIQKARIKGIEATFTTQIDDWTASASLTLLDPENRSSGPNRGNVLPRRARETYSLDVDRQIGDFSVGATLFAAGKRYDDLANMRKLGGYVTVDLRAEYIVTEGLKVQARVENLFDEDYETAAFFNQPGRNFFLTLRYQR